MNVLVTGSSGFFGSWVVPALEEAGHTVVPYDIKDGDDILDRANLLAKLQGCEGLLHMAAIPHFDKKIPVNDYLALNVSGTSAVLETAKQAGVRQLVYISSGAIYGFHITRLDGWVTPPIKESLQASDKDWDLVDAYGRSKMQAEWVLHDCGDKMSAVALRINGIEPRHKGIVETGAHWGWWCSQALAVKAILAALRRKKRGFVAVNVGEPNENLSDLRLKRLLRGTL